MKQIAIAILSLDLNQVSYSTVKIPRAVSRGLMILLILFLFVAEVSRIYLVMPFPGSQLNETIDIAYWLDRHIVWIRILVLLFVAVAFARIFKKGKTWEKVSLLLTLLAYFPLFIFLNFRVAADQKFHQPTTKSFIPASESTDKSKLVIGVVINGEAKAYPIQLIGYHHQVVDTIGNEPVIITYCTVCRTGRVYSSRVNGREEVFRLVGMDHFNAVFEDQTTKSWWQQASGRAIAGPLKGSVLKEIPSSQLPIESWIREYPNSVVMEPDSLYEERYFGLEDYDKGTMQSSLVKRDYRSWQPKSWIVGVRSGFFSMAYDWNELVKRRVIQDTLEDVPILVTMETDTTSFHVYDRRVNGSVFKFNICMVDNLLTDQNTGSVWNMDGRCIDGRLKGQQLKSVQAYNEFWHAWERFEPNTKQHISKE
ncbi:MAG TPA: DUF3179 domain-containing (seleno)protein [Chitinophagaceae bacterium]|nr:DUF3179 domain-containing (seleno)protein [Chitinophagaceae bacterium]